MKSAFNSLARVLPLLFAAHWTTIDCHASEKEALLIANSNYSNFGGGLANAIPDADKLSSVLRNLGFRISVVKNADKEEMLEAIRSFEDRIRGTNALAFFHYGGHGVQVDGKNYLLPANADIPDERRVATRAVDLDEVIGALDSASPRASILVIDACRDNPLPAVANRSATRGLAVVSKKPKNSIIIFAAEAGNAAKDGLFTPVFASNLALPGLSINQIMQRVRSQVFEKSSGGQTPGEYNQLFEDLFLGNSTPVAIEALNTLPPSTPVLESPHSVSPTPQGDSEATGIQSGDTESLKISMEPVVASPAAGRFLRARYEIELSNSSLRDRVEKNLPILQKAALEILSSQEISQLDSPRGREPVRAALISAFNSLLGAGTVKNVFFTEFVML